MKSRMRQRSKEKKKNDKIYWKNRFALGSTVSMSKLRNCSSPTPVKYNKINCCVIFKRFARSRQHNYRCKVIETMQSDMRKLLFSISFDMTISSAQSTRLTKISKSTQGSPSIGGIAMDFVWLDVAKTVQKWIPNASDMWIAGYNSRKDNTNWHFQVPGNWSIWTMRK